MGIENDSVGIDVSHNLKSLCIPVFKPYTNNSSSGIQLIDKWQFWSKTQYPLEQDSSTSAFAFLPCPCPKDIDRYLSPIPIYEENFKKSATGSEPADSTKMSGLTIDESL